MKRRKPIIFTNIAIVFVEIVGLIYSIFEYGWGMFRFYTQDSNYFATITSVILLIYLIKDQDVPKWVTKLRYIAMLMLVITFFVTAFVLAPLYGKDYLRMFTDGSKLYQHLLGPVLYFVSFFAFERRVPKEKSCMGYGLVPTIIYAIILVILNIVGVVDGPYPFLRVLHQPIYMSFVWTVGILGFALLVAWAVWKLGTLSQKNPGITCKI